MPKVLVFDLETDGFLRKMTRIHVMGIKDPDTNETWIYRHNDNENTIADGVAKLMEADVLVGHNSIAFDVPAIKKIFPDFAPKAILRDTMVMCRVAAPDIKSHDFRLWKQELLPGNLIGSHSLEAWGYRLQKRKGDYSADMEKKGLDPWAAWNQEMEDYCILDVEITSDLWKLAQSQNVPETCLDLEHGAQAVCSRMENNGFPFDKAGGEKLARALEAEIEEIKGKLIAKYGSKFVPDKKYRIAPDWQAPTTKPKTYPAPRTEWGEDDSRKWWGDITIPKRDRLVGDRQYRVGAAYCKAKWVEFNPGSRQQIVERLVDEGWTPTEFTETGAPSTEDSVLKKLAETNPVARDLSEYLFLQKLFGQIASGANSWLKSYDEETGCVHPYTNTGGAVTGRCTHSSPNIAQVPGVLVADVLKKDGTINPKFILPDGTVDPRVFKPDGSYYKKLPLLGRTGEFGWECRSLFRAPEHWVQVGIDLAGIEFRCLAELVSEFDGGELINVVLTGDVHQFNMDKTGIPSRDIVKRVLYGLLYGAGDEKLGYTAKPTASPTEARSIGQRLRAQLMAGLPALKKAIDKVQREASRGYLIGLDGRRLKIRSEHSALNTRLQSDAALIAKKWIILTEQYALDSGLHHGWRDGEFYGDFAMLAFVHDEQQNCVDPDKAERFADIAIEAAKDAGKFFGFSCRIDAEAKIGPHWAACH